MKKAIFLVLSLFVLSVSRAEAAVNFDSYPSTVTLSEGQSRYEIGWTTRGYYTPAECSAGPWLKNLPVSSRGVGKRIVSRDYSWSPARTKTVYNSFKATLTNIEGLLGSKVDYSEPAPLVVVVRCKQRSGDKLEETDSIQLSFIKKSQPAPRPVSARNLGDLEPQASAEAIASPILTPEESADVFGAPNPTSFLSQSDPIGEKKTEVAVLGREPESKSSPTISGDSGVKTTDNSASVESCVCGKDASGNCASSPAHNRKCVGSYLVDYYYCQNKLPDEVAIEGNPDYPKKITEKASICDPENKGRVSECSPCGRGVDGKCVIPVNNKKCAGGYLVDYYYCPNDKTASPVEGDPLYAKTLNANDKNCKEAFKKEFNPSCLPCGSDSNGNCVEPTSYDRCSANEEHRGERASFYACANQPNPLNNPLLNNPKYPVGYVKDSSCSSLYKLNTPAPASPVTVPTSGSGQSSGGSTESKSPAVTPPPSAPACDSPCGKDSAGKCVTPARYNRCSANEEFKRAYFYACPNKGNPLDNPILGNSSYRVTYEKDPSCSRPYIPGSGSSSSTPTPQGGGTPSSGGSGSQTPSGGTTPSTGSTSNPTAPTVPAVSAPKVIDCSTCSQCGCNSDKTACVQPVTAARCSNNKPGYWATFQTCPGADTPAAGTSPSYTLDLDRCPTFEATPAFRATTRFFGSIIGGISGLLSNWR